MGLVALWHEVFLDQGSNPFLLHWQAGRFFATEPSKKPQRSLYFFWLYQVLAADVGFSSLTPRSNPGPLHRVCGVLTSGPPGKFPETFLYYILVLPFYISLLWTPGWSEGNSTLALRESQGKSELIPSAKLFWGLLTARDFSRCRSRGSEGGVQRGQPSFLTVTIGEKKIRQVKGYKGKGEEQSLNRLSFLLQMSHFELLYTQSKDVVIHYNFPSLEIAFKDQST